MQTVVFDISFNLSHGGRFIQNYDRGTRFPSQGLEFFSSHKFLDGSSV